ncbi:MAG: hypothetical protein SPD85_01850 [Candidatus Cryptobacteroides sp.]|nr:hypothetical protein [Candidatus Cryptobacteroides sp.]
MKTAKFLTAVFSAAAITALSVSCNKDNTTPGGGDPGTGETQTLTLSQSSIDVKAGESATVEITSGNGGYTVKTADAETATASVEGTTITVNGIKAGSTMITVMDAAKQAKPLQVKVTKSGTNAIPTDVLYDIEVFSSETGASYAPEWVDWQPTLTKNVKGTYIASILDIKNGATNASSYKSGAAVTEFMANPTIDEGVILLGGYIADGTSPDYDYSCPAVMITNNDDASHPGCKVVTVIASCLGGYLRWEDGKYVSRPGTAWYDPSDGSITLKDCSGELYWGGEPPLTWKFNYNRKYTPVK